MALNAAKGPVDLQLMHRSSAVTEDAQGSMALLRVFYFEETRTFRLWEQDQECRLSTSTPGFSLLQGPAQYTKQPNCSLQARVGPARPGLAFMPPRRRRAEYKRPVRFTPLSTTGVQEAHYPNLLSARFPAADLPGSTATIHFSISEFIIEIEVRDN